MKRLRELIQGLRAAARSDAEEAAALDASAREEWAYAAGLLVWVYGLPLLRVEALRRNMALLDAPLESLPFAPLNQLGHMRQLPTSDSDLPFTPNVDTLYSGSLVELADGPLVFVAPELEDRYWSLEVADAFLSNLPYLGTRATGTQAGAWLLAAPDWSGEVPAGLELYRATTNTIVLALRVRIEGAHELDAIRALQDGFALTTVEGHRDGSLRPPEPAKPPVMPLDDHDLAYYTTLCRLLAHNSPYPRDESVVHLMRVLGLAPGARVDPDAIDPAVRRGLVRAAEEGPRTIGWKVKYRGVKNAAGWNVDLTGGSYGTDYLARAEGAIQGLFVHDAEECTYFHTYHDGNGNPLDGAKAYTIHFGADRIPRTHPLGFWSITGYEPSFKLIPNEWGRYSIQSSDPGLERDPDGGLTLHVGPEAPKSGRANALATDPTQPFRLNFRVYLPEPDVIDPARVDHFLPPVLPA